MDCAAVHEIWSRGGWRSKILQRAAANSPFVVPAQPVDATPFSALLRQCFRGRTVRWLYSAKT
jgi:hypothetical protein